MKTSEILQECEIIFLLGANEIDINKLNLKAFIVYIGHHGDRIAEIADVILPATAFTGKNSTYVNLEGTVQNTQAAITPLGQSKIDWQIILELAGLCGIALKYSDLLGIRKRMAEINHVFKGVKHFKHSIMPSRALK